MELVELEKPQRWQQPPWGMSQEGTLTMSNSKTCNKCGQILPTLEFYADSYQKDGLRPNCKTCERKRKADFYYANKESRNADVARWKSLNKDRVAASAAKYYASSKDRKKADRAASFKRWREANPEKDLLRGQRRRANRKKVATYLVTPKDICKLLARPCIYCGKESTQIDHVIPISRGGTHGIGNLIGACASCNQSKRDKFIMEWKKKW